MSRYSLLLILLLCCAPLTARAQPPRLQPGDPPNAALITISAPDANGQAEVSGAQGAVFPNAYLLVRNLFTGQTALTQAGVTGGFRLLMDAAPGAPYWISPSTTGTPQDERDLPGSPAGGPGTILYAPDDEPTAAAPMTRLVIDGDLADWDNTVRTALVTGETPVYALYNQDSLYIGARTVDLGVSPHARLIFTLDSIRYALTLEPGSPMDESVFSPLPEGEGVGVSNGMASLTRVNPGTTDLGVQARASVMFSGEVVEVRLPLDFVERVNQLTLDEIDVLNVGDDSELATITVGDSVPFVEQLDGIARMTPAAPGATRFYAGSPLPPADPASDTNLSDNGYWLARGDADDIRLNAGDPFVMSLDFALYDLEALPTGEARAALVLLPIALAGEEGAASAVTVPGYDNGWSSDFTQLGLPIRGLPPRVTIDGGTAAPGARAIVTEDSLQLPLDYAFTMPEDAPRGLYTARVRLQFESASGALADGLELILPLVINVGEVEETILPMALFLDMPVDGARGARFESEAGRFALDDGVRFSPAVTILPPSALGSNGLSNASPIAYSLEPYLLNLLNNRADLTLPPLIPFDREGGTLRAVVYQDDQQVFDSGRVPIVQNRVSTAARDDRDRFGTSTTDVMQWTTLDVGLTSFVFEDDGDYRIEMQVEATDRYGNRYGGGGQHRLIAAQPLDIEAAIMLGTPFEVGDTMAIGARVTPGLPASISVDLRVVPAQDSSRTGVVRIAEGTADEYGVWQPTGDDAGYTFDQPGEYLLIVSASYRDPAGRLWEGITASAGVIAPRTETASTASGVVDLPGSDLVAHGARGLPDQPRGTRERPAQYFWTTLIDSFGLDDDAPIRLHAPYFSGDVMWLPAGDLNRVRPLITLADRPLPGDPPSSEPYPDEIGMRSADGARRYAYVTVARPGVVARQFVLGGENGLTNPYGVPASIDWLLNDPANQQVGAGAGALPNDYAFLFGGVVDYPTPSAVDTAAPEATPAAEAPTITGQTAIYASSVMITDPAIDGEARVLPGARGADGGADGGTLLATRGINHDLLFVPLATRPGDILTIGDPIVMAGQIAPTIAAHVVIFVTPPTGRVRRLEGTANRVGYFYQPTPVVTDEPGVWTVTIVVRPAGQTSVGRVEPPAAEGGVPGAVGRTFSVYVQPRNAAPLAWNRLPPLATIPPGISYNFSFTIDSGLNDLRAYYTLTIPSQILEDVEIRLSGRTLTYVYNPADLSNQFPNIEYVPQGAGAHVSDPKTLTFFVTGTDTAGRVQAFARRFVILHDRLVAVEALSEPLTGFAPALAFDTGVEAGG